MKKNVLSFCVVLMFMIFALASQVNKIHYGAFNYDNHVEDIKEKKNYIVRNDGTKLYGEKISWKAGMFTKEQIEIDKQKFPMAEVKGYRDGNFYYARHGKQYIKRIVRGKINVYVDFTQVTTTSTDRNGRMTQRTHTRTDHYSQQGDDGELVAFGGQDDMKALVKDCPLSVEMIDLKNSKIRRAIKADPNYLNKVFEVYNNDCKPVTNR